MKKHRPILITCSILLLLCLCTGSMSAAIGGGVYLTRPSVAAESAGGIRRLFGNDLIRIAETLLFTLEDQINQLVYGLGLKQAQAPWQPPTPVPTFYALTPTLTPTESPLATRIPRGTQTPDALNPEPPTSSSTPENPIGSRSDRGKFTLVPLQPIGNLEGEGRWVDYLFSPNGQVIAQRTFLQPDPHRPYSVIAIVAFDLTQTRLHFVLGYEEPATAGMDIYAAVAPEDLVPGKLVAAFNGGFLAGNGNYGAMSGGVQPIPPSLGLATLAIYRGGALAIDRYEDLPDPHGMVAFRQNGPLIIHDGEPTPEVKRNRIQDWGGSINGEIVTYRSGIGLNTDRTILYYFAGATLDLPILANAMQSAGVKEAMQLDINNYWVYFSAFFPDGNTIRPEPLLPTMQEHIDRYLHPSPRDFFYITIHP